MRSYAALAVSALLVGTLCQFAAAEGLFKDEVATVGQQRSLLQASNNPLYGCPNADYPSRRSVRVFVAVSGSPKLPAFFGKGQRALFLAIEAVYKKAGRPSIAQRSITGPRGQFAAKKAKVFEYIFTLPIGRCGTDKKVLTSALRKAIVEAKGDRVRWVRLSTFLPIA